eukprot:TRINITY_DN866_c0_g1_i4.p1 TRINITY_DN866_c0_g1~~TRINITY_DN866_c0_g1_i4.p1  ORF type:complete len:634 (+),score=165.89 TRINITY_DN866_c0_g1_i4:222-2123(+)
MENSNFPWLDPPRVSTNAQVVVPLTAKDNFLSRRPSQMKNPSFPNTQMSIPRANSMPQQNPNNGPSINISNNISFAPNSYGGFATMPNYISTTSVQNMGPNMHSNVAIHSPNSHNLMGNNEIQVNSGTSFEIESSTEKNAEFNRNDNRIYNANHPISPPATYPTQVLSSHAKSQMKGEPTIPFGGFNYPQSQIVESCCNARTQSDVSSPIELSFTLDQLKEMNKDELALLAFELQTQLASYARNSLWTAIQGLKNNPLFGQPMTLFSMAKSRLNNNAVNKNGPTNQNSQTHNNPSNGRMNDRSPSSNVGPQNGMNTFSPDNGMNPLNRNIKSEANPSNPMYSNQANNSKFMNNTNGHSYPNNTNNMMNEVPFNPGPYMQNGNQGNSQPPKMFFPNQRPPATVVRSLSQPQMSINQNQLNNNMNKFIQPKTTPQHNLNQQNRQNFQQGNNGDNKENSEIRGTTDMMDSTIQKLRNLIANSHLAQPGAQSDELVSLSAKLQPVLNGVCKMAAISHPECDRAFQVLSVIFEKLEVMRTMGTPTPIVDDILYVPWKDKDGKDNLGLLDQLWYLWDLLIKNASSVLGADRIHYWNNYASGIQLKLNEEEVQVSQGKKRTGSEMDGQDCFKVPKTESGF